MGFARRSSPSTARSSLSTDRPPTLRRYRVEHQREQLELWGVSTGEVHYLSVSPLDAERADVFVIYRCAVSEQVEEFVRRAHELGKRVYFDVDDLVWTRATQRVCP